MTRALCILAALTLAGCSTRGPQSLSPTPEPKETAMPEKRFEEDVIRTSGGDLKITFIGHGYSLNGPNWPLHLRTGDC